jgi:type II secretory pathway pseudopilin PulG
MRNTGFSFDNEKGAVTILVAILLPVLLGVTAFAIDFGYTRIVRNQLQNAADAAALAACNHFYDRNPPIFSNPDELIPNWNDAVTEALNAIPDNSADNNDLQTGTTETGWWDITQAYPGSMWPDPLTSPPPDVPSTADHGPAIRVSVAKTGNQNDGPVLSFFGRIFGFGSYDGINANATAVAASPGQVRPGAFIPVATAQDVVDTYYQTHNNVDNPIVIGSPYHYGTDNTLAGQWTSMTGGESDVPTVQGLIENGNPAAINFGDEIFIQTGTKDTLFDSKNQPSIESIYAGEDVVLPIVSGNINGQTGSFVELVGLVGFHIICAGKGCNDMEFTDNEGTHTLKNNEKVIMGYFTTAPNYGTGAIGPHYGPLDRCRLCE